MADQSDVEQALVGIVATALYPSGVATAADLSPVNGAVTNISRGWPTGTTLDAALAAQSVLVRVYPEPGMTRNTTRFMLEWRTAYPPAATTLTASVSGSVVTFGGSGSASHVVAVIFGSTVLAYRLLPGDTPSSVAAALAAQVRNALAAGPVLTLPTNLPVTARVNVDQMTSVEVRRQDQGFRVSVWSANDAARDATASAIDQALTAIPVNDQLGNPEAAGSMFLPLADGSFGWLRYRNTVNLDGAEKAGLYRRDLCYLVEYGTDVATSAPPFNVGEIPFDGYSGMVIERGQTITPTGTIIV